MLFIKQLFKQYIVLKVTLLKVTLLAGLLMSVTLTNAENAQSANHQAQEPLIDLYSLQQLFKSLEQQSKILGIDTENYIRCIEQNTEAEGGTLPDNPAPPNEITREWLSQFLDSLSAGVNSSETCQFLLDDLLQKLPQLPKTEPQQLQGI